MNPFDVYFMSFWLCKLTTRWNRLARGSIFHCVNSDYSTHACTRCYNSYSLSKQMKDCYGKASRVLVTILRFESEDSQEKTINKRAKT